MGKLNAAFMAGVVLGLALHSNAQSAVASGFTDTVQPIQAIGEVSAQPDTIVTVAAESQGLSPIAREDLPRGGTYWWVQPGGQAVPTPFPSTDMSQAIYQITDGQFLVDQTDGAIVVQRRQLGSRTAADSIAAAATAQAGAVVNLINQVLDAEDARQTRMMLRSFGMDDEEDSGSSDSPIFAMIDTNGLWLEITNVSNGWSYLNLHTATNLVYAIESTTNLLTSWNVETELWPSGDQTNVMPFSIQNFGRQDLFFRAQDWTGVDSDSDGIPDWWIWKYFGNLSVTATNLDSTGLHTVGDDYTNGVDPNVITFTVEATNDYVNTTTANAQLNLTAGNPSYYAVLVNGETTTNWQTFTTTNLTVYLGSTDGVYAVNIGLRGLPTDATQTWNDYSFTLDRVAPLLTVTNPVGSTVIKPYLQLQGFANEQLSSLSYDISNAVGLVTNQDAFVTDQGFDTNKFDYTTNYFQAYDVPLTNGVNHFTLRVADRAGNTTTTNFNVTLDYSTVTNPVIKLTWPTNGMPICGSSFTLRGWVDDETAAVSASITDTNGDTNIITGSVERSGVLWVENLPLNEGTNTVTLWVTNAAGLSSATNLTLVKSDMTLALTTVTGDLWKPTVSVSGIISEPDYSVWVNGIQGTNNGDGTWSADNVPVSASGVASFDMNASSSAGDPYSNTNIDKPAEIVLVSYDETKSSQYDSGLVDSNNVVWTKNYSESPTKGYSQQINYGVEEGFGYDYERTLNWTDTNDTELDTDNGGTNYFGSIPDWSWIDGFPTDIPDLDQVWGCASCGPGYSAGNMTHYFANNIHWHYDLGGGSTADLRVTARTRQKLFTGGKANSHKLNLFQLQCGATEYHKPPGGGWWGTPGTDIDKSRLRALGKWVGADGNLWVMLPDNASPDLLLNAPARHYNAWATQQKYEMNIVVNSSTSTSSSSNPLWPDHVPDYNTYCVGQKLNFVPYWTPSTPPFADEIVHWSLPGNYVNEFLAAPDPDNNSGSYTNHSSLLANETTSCWYVNKLQSGTASIGMNLQFANGQSVSLAVPGQFSVYRPTLSNCQTNGYTYYAALVPTNFPNELKLGDNIPNGFMRYGLQVNSIAPFSGSANIVQLVNATRSLANSYGGYQKTTGGQFWLDNSNPYFNDVTFPINANTFYYTVFLFIDQPSYGLNFPAEILTTVFGAFPPDLCSINDSFQDYIIFKPDGADSIYVTLGRVFWSWSASTSNSFGAWSAPTYQVNGPSNPDDSDEFPTWSATLYNSGVSSGN